MSGENIGAIGAYGSMNPWMMNMYSNQIAMNDMFEDMYMTNPMSMNGSLFSGMGMGYPGFPTFTGINNDQWMEQMDKWQDYSIDRRVRYQEKSRNADLRLNSPLEGIAEAARVLNEKIHKDEQEQILPALSHYVAAVKAAYPNGTDADILNRARSMYEQQFHSDLVDDIRAKGKDSFTQGFIQAVTLGLADNKTAEENIADITGQPVGRGDQTKKILGRAAGGAVLGGTGAYLLSFSKYFKFLGKSKPLLAAAVGAVIAGLAALTSGPKTSLNKDVKVDQETAQTSH